MGKDIHDFEIQSGKEIIVKPFMSIDLKPHFLELQELSVLDSAQKHKFLTCGSSLGFKCQKYFLFLNTPKIFLRFFWSWIIQKTQNKPTLLSVGKLKVFLIANMIISRLVDRRYCCPLIKTCSYSPGPCFEQENRACLIYQLTAERREQGV